MYVRVFHKLQGSVQQLVTSPDSTCSEESGAQLFLLQHRQSVWDTHSIG